MHLTRVFKWSENSFDRALHGVSDHFGPCAEG